MKIRAQGVLILAAAAVAALLPPSVSGQNPAERFTGFAINMNSGPRTASIDFTVERWSTEGERQQLLEIIAEHKDPTDRLLSALQRMPKAGYIRGSQTLGWDLRYARQSPLENGGRRIVLATDRPIGFWEARNSPRSMDYPFTLIEIQLDKDDKGVGKILAGTKIFVNDKKELVLENFGQQPIRFNEIHRVK